MNAKALSRVAFHGVVTMMYCYTLVSYQKLPPMPHKKSHEHYAGCWKFLTYWNLVVQFLFFLLSFIIDFMKASSSNYHKFTKVRDKFFASIAMPYGLFVVAVFWILYSIDRELIFPKVLDGIFPVWLNHVSHTAILPVLLMESYILKHRHPRKKDGMTITAVFGLIYAFWVLYLALVKEIWPYPILYILNWGQRFIFFGFTVGLTMLMYLIGEKINCCFWGDGIVSKVK